MIPGWTKGDILKWKEKYNNERGNQLEEEALRKRFRENDFITHDDLRRVVVWKFGNMIGRQKRVLDLIKNNIEKDVIEKSRAAFQSQSDKDGLRNLMKIHGVGISLATVILSFYDPQEYGIIDIHARRELFGKEPSVFDFLTKLREISEETNLPCRDVEKALFERNYGRSRTEELKEKY